jgi:hypothetical protein
MEVGFSEADGRTHGFVSARVDAVEASVLDLGYETVAAQLGDEAGRAVSSPSGFRRVCGGGRVQFPLVWGLFCQARYHTVFPCFSFWCSLIHFLLHDVTFVTRGKPASVCATRITTLYSVASTPDADHEAVIRFCGEAPRRRAHSDDGIKAKEGNGSPPPRITVRGRLSASGY